MFTTFLSALVLVEFFICARCLIVYDDAQYRSIRAKLVAADDLAGFSNKVMRFAEE